MYVFCVAAPCATQGQTDCHQQNRGYYYDYDYFYDDEYYFSQRFDCSCHSDCFSSGDCCSDISVTENCFGNIAIIIILTLQRWKYNLISFPPDKKCKPGEVRLVGEVTNSTGRLEFCANGVWGGVCNRLGYWGPDNARVVCHQLGFSEEGKIGVGVY